MTHLADGLRWFRGAEHQDHLSVGGELAIDNVFSFTLLGIMTLNSIMTFSIRPRRPGVNNIKRVPQNLHGYAVPNC